MNRSPINIMPKARTHSFVTEIPLKATAAQAAALNKRFEAARQVYNACLGEALKRLDRMRQAKAWQRARKMPKGKERDEAFRDLRKQFGFREYDLCAYAKQFGYSWPGHHLDSQTVKRLAERSFISVEQYLLNAKRGKPKFKSYGQLNAVESVNNRQGITWRGDRVVWNAGRHGKKLTLTAIIDPKDPVTQHGLASRVKYVRLVRRALNGKTRFYAQLVNEGKPYPRFGLGQGDVGLDIGPSTVAIVGPGRARLKLFCEELAGSKAEERRLLRKLDRQRRANNPGNYNEDGTVKPRQQRKRWVTSNRQRKTAVKLAEIRRKQRAYRKSLHGQLINEIIQMGDCIKLEKLSYVAFQRTFGKSVGVRAPGMFVARLRQKVNDLGGLVEEFSTYHTKLSQVDHQTGEYQKKPLSQRWHQFADGERVQRDLYSAFLAACVEDGDLNRALAAERWQHVKPLLAAAVEDAKEAGKRPASFGF